MKMIDDYLDALSFIVAEDLDISPSQVKEQICGAIHLARQTRDNEEQESMIEDLSKERYTSLIYDDIFQTISALYLGHTAQAPLNKREEMLHHQIQTAFSKENCADISNRIRAILADVEHNPAKCSLPQIADELSDSYESLISILCQKMFFYGVKLGRSVDSYENDFF